MILYCFCFCFLHLFSQFFCVTSNELPEKFFPIIWTFIFIFFCRRISLYRLVVISTQNSTYDIFYRVNTLKTYRVSHEQIMDEEKNSFIILKKSNRILCRNSHVQDSSSHIYIYDSNSYALQNVVAAPSIYRTYSWNEASKCNNAQCSQIHRDGVYCSVSFVNVAPHRAPRILHECRRV